MSRDVVNARHTSRERRASDWEDPANIPASRPSPSPVAPSTCRRQNTRDRIEETPKPHTIAARVTTATAWRLSNGSAELHNDEKVFESRILTLLPPIPQTPHFQRFIAHIELLLPLPTYSLTHTSHYTTLNFTPIMHFTTVVALMAAAVAAAPQSAPAGYSQAPSAPPAYSAPAASSAPPAYSGAPSAPAYGSSAAPSAPAYGSSAAPSGPASGSASAPPTYPSKSGWGSHPPAYGSTTPVAPMPTGGYPVPPAGNGTYPHPGGVTSSGAPMPSETYTVPPSTGGAARFGPVMGGLLLVGGLALVS